MFSYGTASSLPIPTPSSAPNIGSGTGAAGGGSGVGNNSGSGMNGNSNNNNINATPSLQNYTSQNSGSSLSSLSSLSNSLSSSLSDEDTDNELKVIEEDSSEEDESTPESLSWTGENECRDGQLGLTRTTRRLKSDDRIQQIEEEMELDDAPCLPKKSSLYEPFSFSPNAQTHYHMFHSTQSQLQFMQQLPQLQSQQTSTIHRAPPSLLPISSTFQLMTEQQVQALKRIDDSDAEGSKPQLPHILQTQQQIQQQLHMVHSSSFQFQVGNTLKGLRLESCELLNKHFYIAS